jgi:hypothetical protein
MTVKSLGDYVADLKIRYIKSGKKEKGKILDEYTRVTGCHRKAAIRLLHNVHKNGPKGHRGRPRKYGNDILSALKTLWEASDHLCSKRLQPFLPELISAMHRHNEIKLPSDIQKQLIQMSTATMDRLLGPLHKAEGYRPLSTTKPGTLLKSSIPIRTFADWNEHRPGFLEADLVAHCGDTVDGFYLNTLSAVDVSTGWSEYRAVWGKGQQRVGSAVHEIKRRLPFPLLGLDSDNGSEFINQYLVDYCKRWQITFTRSRSYKKNDSCYVEQKNWSVVRRVIGYDRYSSKQAFETLNRIYDLLHLYVNFFQPVMHLIHKTRHGARVYKVYDEARTPYQRLLDFGILTEAKKQQLAAVYYGLNPVLLRTQIDGNLESLWRLADRIEKRPKIT